MTPGVVAVIVTHRRPEELRRLLDSLAASTVSLLGCVISDHSPPGARSALPPHLPFPVELLDDPSNPGPGAGWANAARHALRHFGPALTAVWYLDDDVVIPPHALEVLEAEKQAAQADAIAPLLEDDQGRLWAFPEPAPKALRGPIRQANTPRDALALIGSQPVPFCWCTGACFLVDAKTLATAGFHRNDFRILGEDLEYSMRIAATGRAVFTCQVAVPHLPPASSATSPEAGRLKFQCLLQNLCYLSFHSPHRGHLKSYLPGNFRRFFRTYGPTPWALLTAFRCFWQGALRGRPAGYSRGEIGTSNPQ